MPPQGKSKYDPVYPNPLKDYDRFMNGWCHSHADDKRDDRKEKYVNRTSKLALVAQGYPVSCILGVISVAATRALFHPSTAPTGEAPRVTRSQTRS